MIKVNIPLLQIRESEESKAFKVAKGWRQLIDDEKHLAYGEITLPELENFLKTIFNERRHGKKR
jgi:hypothetical protein